MDYKLEKVKVEEKDILYNLLQFALYDGSQYTGIKINDKGVFDYRWFDNYFTDSNRDVYFIKDKTNILGFVMVNQHMKVFDEGHSIAEFLILPAYRRSHIGSKIAWLIFDMFPGNWEVEPIENSMEAECFWRQVIDKYTKSNYNVVDRIYTFKN